MEDCVISVAAKVAEGLVKPTIRQGQYFFCVNKAIRNLGNEKNELISERDRIQSLVEHAKERTEIIEDAVKKWLNDVKNLLEEVEKLEQEMKENHRFRGQFPTWRTYCLCKKMTKKIKTITYLKNNSMLEPFSHPDQLPGIEYISSRNFTYFESTKVAYNQLMEAIQDDDTYMIGLYGMGGSGKTNLVIEVGKKALELNLFDRVILVTVSQTPNIRSIQGKIADMLCMTLKEETEEGRAQRLWLRLKEEKRVLIIVDDIWAKLNLESIGIHLDDYKLNFKALLTTRLRQVCTSMECQKEIILNLLSEEEAWNLFQKHARFGDRFSSNLLKVAREVSNECKGLPIAIEAVACSLKGKGDDEWKVALESLRHSEPFDDQEGEGVRCAYNCLKLSYDYLRNKEAEMLLLLCSMFPEDHEIFIEDLIKYGVGLGVCANFNSFDLARSRIRAGINKLVDSCLLLHSTLSGHHVRMHDMVRDVTLWIGSRSVHHKILVNHAKDLHTLAEDGAVRDSFAVSSWCKETDILYHLLDAPKLEILLINTKQENTLNFLCESSEGVKGLKVMAMINSFYRTPLLLPQSIHCWTNLRTLRLRGWDLGDMSFLVSLTRLEILDLSNCYFKDLPYGMEKLSKLKLLDLSHYEIPENLNYEAIGSCLQLEELYAFGYNRRCPCQRMEDIVTLPNLQRFVIHLGQFETLDNEESIRVLHLQDFNISNLGASKQNLLQRAEDVCLNNLHGGCKNIIPDLVQVVGCMTDLTKLCLCSCLEIECLIDTTYHYAGSFLEDALLPKLIKLELSEMDNLIEMCRGPPVLALEFFKKLERLFIRNCKQLYNIFPTVCNLCNLKVLKIWNRHSSAVAVLFSMSVARSLQQLEELLIQGCEQLKHIVTREGEDGTNKGHNSHKVFLKLKKLSICDCPKLEFIFPVSFVRNGLSQLQEIEIESASGLKYVFGHYDHEAHSSHQNQVEIMLPPLKVFNLYNVENLIGICPKSYHLGCPSLEELDCQRCPKLTTSCISVTIGSKQRPQHLSMGVALDHDQENHLTSNLRQLLLGGLPELRFIWLGTTSRQVLSFKFLHCLKVDSCSNLKSVFSTTIKGSLPELTFLSICHCEELEEIIAENAEPQNLFNTEVCFPKLSELRIEKCNKLKNLFSFAMVRMLPQLSSIHVSDAAQLEEAFRHCSDNNIDNGDQIMLPELRKIELKNLPNFGNIFKGFNFQSPKLQQLYMNKCPNFSPILRGTQVQVDAFQHRQERRQVFWLIDVISNLEAFLNLEVLHVTKSREEGIFQLQVEGELSTNNNRKLLNSNLGYLTLCDLPELRFIWNGSSKFLSLEKLTHVSILKCPKLRTIFNSCIVKCLPKLQTLSVSSCEELKEIISSDSENAQLGTTVHISEAAQLNQVSRHGNEGKTDNEDQIMLPDLRKIELKKLPSFVNIFQGFNFEAPKLQQLYINVVPKFAQRGTRVNTVHRTTEERQVFWLITATSNQLHKRRHHGALQAFLNFEVLHVTKCEAEGVFQVKGELGSNSEWKPLNSNLEYIKLCDLHELRFIWKGPSSFLSLVKLTEVSLSNCPKLKTIFSQSIARCLPKLHSLRIMNCDELEEIMSSDSKNGELKHAGACPQQVCFPRLYKIVVEQCNKLKCLFYDFMDSHFPELQSVEIKECSQVEKVLGFKGEGADDENGKLILLPKLKKLVLQNLPIFFENSPGFSFQPWHEYLVMDCPKYNCSSTGVSTSCLHTATQKRQIFWLITATSSQLCKQRSSAALEAFLNFEVLDVRNCRAEGIFKLQVEGELSNSSELQPLNSNLHDLNLFDLPELRYIWNGFSKSLSLEKLKEVSVSECSKLKTIFSPFVIRYLPMLEIMRISNCDELEEIMSSDPDNTQLKQVCFPQLCQIEVKHCNKLKCLFYDPLACHFPELKSLEIKECCQIEQVFGFKGEANDQSPQRGDDEDEDGNQILFPKLHKLVLERLPIFFEIFPGFNLPPEFYLLPWNEYLVVDCPKYDSIST